MYEQSISPRDPDDAMARQSGAVSEDVRPVTTDEKADTTTQGSLHGTAGPEGAERADNLQTEPPDDGQ